MLKSLAAALSGRTADPAAQQVLHALAQSPEVAAALDRVDAAALDRRRALLAEAEATRRRGLEAAATAQRVLDAADAKVVAAQRALEAAKLEQQRAQADRGSIALLAEQRVGAIEAELHRTADPRFDAMADACEVVRQQLRNVEMIFSRRASQEPELVRSWARLCAERDTALAALNTGRGECAEAKSLAESRTETTARLLRIAERVNTALAPVHLHLDFTLAIAVDADDRPAVTHTGVRQVPAAPSVSRDEDGSGSAGERSAARFIETLRAAP